MPKSRQFADDLAESHALLGQGACSAALDFAKSAFAEAQRLTDRDAMAASLNQIAWCCFKLGQAEAGLECATTARRLSTSASNPVELARGGAIEAYLLLDTGLSDEAYETAGAAVATAETAGDAAVLALALNAKAIALAVCRQTDMALPLLDRAIALAAEAGDGSTHAFSLLDLGFCHCKLAEECDSTGDAARALHWRELANAAWDEAIVIAQACGDLWNLRTALVNAAEIFGLRGMTDTAKAYLARAAALPGEVGPSLQIHYLYTLGDLMIRVGDLAGAREVCAEALQLAEVTNQIDHQVNAVERLARVHEALGEFETALAHQKTFHALYVRQSGVATQRRVRAAEIRFESEQLRARATALADQVLLDPLTGIANRRGFEHVVNGLHGRHYVLAVLDLDRFKAVNDSFSHVVGDAVLRRVAALLLSCIGSSGYAARFGGEEFVLILPDIEIIVAVPMMEAICQALRDADWSEIAPGLSATGSMGMASTHEASDLSEIMLLADNRLYAAKAEGRDRIVWCDPEAALAGQ